jgi:hypothetical protein
MSGTALAAKQRKTEMEDAATTRDLFCGRRPIEMQGIVSMVKEWDLDRRSARRVWISEAVRILSNMREIIACPVLTTPFE